jgi:micrococcal nuclease
MSGKKGQKIGPLLKMERRKAGFSQDDVALKSGIGQATISRLESGDLNFRIGTLESFVDALGKKINLISKDAELYHYTAQVQSVYDGDTCRVDIDLGLGIWLRNEKLRLVRINAPEMTGPDKALGIVSRDFLRGLIDGREIIIETLKDRRGKYGRYLAEIWIGQDGIWSNVNDALVAAGHAVYQEY